MPNRQVEAKILIEKSQQSAAIDAFINVEDLRNWWKVESSLIECKPGGLYSLAWGISEAGFSYVSTGLVRSYKAASHLLIDKMQYFNPKIAILGPMSIDIRCVSDGPSHWLKVIQYGYQEGKDWDWYYEAVRIGWPQALKQLSEYLQTK